MWNRRTRVFLGLAHRVFVCVLPAGCLDAQGNRITLQEWFAEREGGPDQGRAPSARTSRTQESETADAGNCNRPQHTPEAAETGPPRQARQTSPDDSGIQNHLAESTDPPAKSKATVSSRGPMGSPPSGDAIRSDVLLVNSEVIRVADVLEPISAELERLAGELPPVIYGTKAGEMIRQEIIESVAQHLVWRKAKQMLTEDMEKGLKKAVDKMEKDRINREFQGRETLYDKYLAKHGKSRDEVRERLRRSIVIDSYLRERLLPLVQAPRKQELLNYYNAHVAEFSEEGRREMFLIDVPIATFLESRRRPTEDELRVAAGKARETIEKAAAALRAGEPFEEVAKRHSRGPNADQGGAWGMIEQPLKGRWEAPSKRLFEMNEGDTGDIIETAEGFFIVKVGRVEPAKLLTFDDAQPQIAITLRQRRFLKLRAEFLEGELRRSTISSLDEFVAEVLRAIPEPKTAGR